MTPEEQVRRKFEALAPHLNERQCRLWAAAEADALGRGGISVVARASGMSPQRIRDGIAELEVLGQTTSPAAKPRPEPVRRPGGGRKALTKKDPGLLTELERLVDPATRGDPMSPLRWTSKSTSRLAEELSAQGHPVSAGTVATLLKEQRYSLQANRKTREGKQHPDRDAQFQHISTQAQAFQERGQPVISVDTKKKELVGDFKNGGREWQPGGQPEEVRVHDFVDRERGKAVPYGVYDLAANEGWVSVGTDHDTAAFAVNSVRSWWQRMGRETYPEASELLITADGGGSNSSQCHLWKTQLQALANETGLAISVCHFPPGTSKWNKIEHRMFCHITQNWRGRPLVSHEVVVALIGSTTTRTGLRVQAELDSGEYPKGTKVPAAELRAVQIERDFFHGEWNYTIRPQKAPGS